MQLTGTGVKISLGYPLDTDTPGFANENLTKVSHASTSTWPCSVNPVAEVQSLLTADVKLRWNLQPPETEAITRFAGGDVYSPDKVCHKSFLNEALSVQDLLWHKGFQHALIVFYPLSAAITLAI